MIIRLHKESITIERKPIEENVKIEKTNQIDTNFNYPNEQKEELLSFYERFMAICEGKDDKTGNVERKNIIPDEKYIRLTLEKIDEGLTLLGQTSYKRYKEEKEKNKASDLKLLLKEEIKEIKPHIENANNLIKANKGKKIDSNKKGNKGKKLTPDQKKTIEEINIYYDILLSVYSLEKADGIYKKLRSNKKPSLGNLFSFSYDLISIYKDNDIINGSKPVKSIDKGIDLVTNELEKSKDKSKDKPKDNSKDNSKYDINTDINYYYESISKLNTIKRLSSLYSDLVKSFSTPQKKTGGKRIFFNNAYYDTYLVNLKDGYDIKIEYVGGNKKNHKSINEVKNKFGKKLLFATNGGIFEPSLKPTGLLIVDGKVINKLNPNNGEGNFFLKPNGVYIIRKPKGCGILSTEKFKKQKLKDISYATQSGPLLLSNGKIHKKINKGSPNKQIRSGVGIIDKNTSVFIISYEKVNFYDLTSLFIEYGCEDALYLDGTISDFYAPDIGRNNRSDGSFSSIIYAIPNK